MSNVYNWTIAALDCYPTSNGQTDVVFTAHWRCDGNDGTTANTGSVYNTIPLVYEAGTPFTPYANLTANLVVSWVQSAMGANSVEAVYSSIDSQIANKKNPPVVTPPLPWNVA